MYRGLQDREGLGKDKTLDLCSSEQALFLVAGAPRNQCPSVSAHPHFPRVGSSWFFFLIFGFSEWLMPIFTDVGEQIGGYSKRKDCRPLAGNNAVPHASLLQIKPAPFQEFGPRTCTRSLSNTKAGDTMLQAFQLFFFFGEISLQDFRIGVPILSFFFFFWAEMDYGLMSDPVYLLLGWQSCLCRAIDVPPRTLLPIPAHAAILRRNAQTTSSAARFSALGYSAGQNSANSSTGCRSFPPLVFRQVSAHLRTFLQCCATGLVCFP